MRHSIKMGVLIGLSVASVSAFMLRFIPLTYFVMVAFLYLYVAVGAATGFTVHRKLTVGEVKKNKNLLKKLKGRWVTLHINPEGRIRALVKDVEDFIYVKFAFPLDKKYRLIEDMYVKPEEIRRVDVD